MEEIYLQMYSFGDFNLAKIESQLKSAYLLGFKGVELFGPNLKMKADEMKKLLSDNHLEAISMHVQANEVTNMIPYAKALNIKYIVIGMQYLPDIASIEAFAETLNEIGELCHKKDIILGYHNHTQEFQVFGEKKIIDILLENTKPEYVSLELDAGWCAAAGYDPIAFIRQHKGRIKLVHLKESSRVIGIQPSFNPEDMNFDDSGKPIFSEEQQELLHKSIEINCAAGKGIVNWKELRKTADACGCNGYIVEREYSYSGNRIQCLKEDIDFYLSNM